MFILCILTPPSYICWKPFFFFFKTEKAFKQSLGIEHHGQQIFVLVVVLHWPLIFLWHGWICFPMYMYGKCWMQFLFWCSLSLPLCNISLSGVLRYVIQDHLGIISFDYGALNKLAQKACIILYNRWWQSKPAFCRSRSSVIVVRPCLVQGPFVQSIVSLTN